MLNETVSCLSVVAAQLVEAACCARDGNTEAAKIHIAHAVARLDGRHRPQVAISRVTERDIPQIQRGGLAPWQARRVAARVDANLAERISTPQLAKSLNLSASHFSRAFKCTFGVSPHAWVLRRRMEVAQGLMLTTSAPLCEIAVICGMADQAHFTHCFRRVFGETPYAWRRNRRGTLEEGGETRAGGNILSMSTHQPGAVRAESFVNPASSAVTFGGVTMKDVSTADPAGARPDQRAMR
jgi:AraC family transcriptional regulator